MAIKDLIVIVDESAGCENRIETALVMARKYDAKLTAVLPQYKELLPDEYIRVLPKSARDLATEHVRKMEDEAAAGVKDIFKRLVETAEWTAKSNFRMIHGNPNDVAGVASRYADLVIVGQEPEGVHESRLIDPGEVVATSGRPMFIVPRNFRPKGFSEHVVLGWNRSKEAARAISDAMQILETKTRITVITFHANADMPDNYGFDIRSHLENHGLQVDHMDINSTSGDHGLDIVNYAAEVNADLIVMGAYTRSRIAQSIFGGATRSALKNTTTPLFLSH